MSKLFGVSGLRGGVGAPMTWFGKRDGAMRRRFEARRTPTQSLSVVSVVSALQSELRTRRRMPRIGP
jgi:hypothetical protein